MSQLYDYMEYSYANYFRVFANSNIYVSYRFVLIDFSSSYELHFSSFFHN